MSSEAKIAICVISYERGVLTERCLQSISKNTVKPYQVFLVDNGSQDLNVVKKLSQWAYRKNTRVIKNTTNNGASAARNQVIELSEGKYRFLAMFDNDMMALPGWDVSAFKTFERGVDLIQPKLLTGDSKFVERGPNQPRSELISANPEFFGKGLTRDHPDVNREDDVAIIGAGIVRYAVFDTIGGYDERLDIGEDFDLSFRARDAGFKLRYAPDCELIHDHIHDPEYDQERARVSKFLTSHVILWNKHGKVLLSPAFLRWFSWLHFHDEPMYMSGPRTIASVPRRLRRRAMRRWIMARYQPVWPSPEVAGKESKILEQKLGMKT